MQLRRSSRRFFKRPRVSAVCVRPTWQEDGTGKKPNALAFFRSCVCVGCATWETNT